MRTPTHVITSPTFTPTALALVAWYVDDLTDAVYTLPVVGFAPDVHTGTLRAQVCDPAGAVFQCDDDEVTAHVTAECVGVTPAGESLSDEDLNRRLKDARDFRRKLNAAVA